ncbi:Uncharacterised protein [Listeria fleischmannii subsp. fleischmannii]|uniref:Uncharacterized protein n=1 Tax=Listeria fleischmannii subsp. fleischmannii TaxID=1671902 RepID=A0A2X3H7F4_9LIST|nr:Uncharacterised protein [Listeria fleischmannii subsp. fleischmannii]
MDEKITVKAEPNVTVTVYNASDNSILTSGSSNTEDYEIVIPEIKRPLAPYVSYYVTATDSAGNVSEKSNIEVTRDTTPPEADPISQTVKLGEAFPKDAKSLVTNVYDNAGVANLSYELITEPDVSQIGYATAVVRITDAAKNYRDITVPVFIEDDSTNSNNEAMLTSRDFTTLAQDVPTAAAELDQFILTNGQVRAWSKPSGADITNQVLITDKGG